MTRTQQIRWILVLALVAGTLSLDIVTKQIALDHLARGQSETPIPALSPYFQLTLSYNTGAAFGILPQAGNIFLIIAIAVVIGMLVFYNRIPEPAHITRMATGLIVGGALGNAIDRVQHGHVVDFIHYSIPELDISNVSNMADHAIVLAVILMFYDSWRVERIEKREARAAEAAKSEEEAVNNPIDFHQPDEHQSH